MMMVEQNAQIAIQEGGDKIEKKYWKPTTKFKSVCCYFCIKNRSRMDFKRLCMELLNILDPMEEESRSREYFSRTSKKQFLLLLK